ncbi:hypothetical protein ACHHYP_17085 [Achlya hypogyna]|uniref:Uncharacterized protein n=1 Tax=Achlya hypogyna TaxID=1202772 RepID=A0A1V9Y5D6_ACHHY|nr:hypothetical protein ACHHYP_17085 [Achlya hypogyna]
MAVSMDLPRASFQRLQCPNCAASYMSFDDRREPYCTSDCKATAKILSIEQEDYGDEESDSDDIDGDVYLICVPKFDPAAINRQRKIRNSQQRLSSPRPIPQRTMFYSGDVISY